MAHMFIRTAVADYAAWRSFFDGKRGFRAGCGALAEQVFQDADDADSLTVIVEFESVAAARAFAAMPELRQNMAEAGVVGPPSIWFAERV